MPNLCIDFYDPLRRAERLRRAQLLKDNVAKLKIGAKVVFSKYKADAKGNTWGLLVGNNINTWVCVCDSTGNQIK